MIRKPEPKEAAKALVAIFKAKGIDIKRSLALEVVATVEGYNDWNTMSAALPAVKADKSAKVPKHPAPAKASKYPEVGDDEGPFTVFFDDADYDVMERFKRAQEVAEVFAAELDYQHVATVRDVAGRLRAMYVGDHTRFRLYSLDDNEVSAEQAKKALQAGIDFAPDTDVTCFGHPENFYDNIVERTEEVLGADDLSVLLGYRVFQTNPDSGRVDHQDMDTPIRLGVLVVHGQLRYVCQDLPADVRERISALLNK